MQKATPTTLVNLSNRGTSLIVHHTVRKQLLELSRSSVASISNFSGVIVGSFETSGICHSEEAFSQLIFITFWAFYEPVLCTCRRLYYSPLIFCPKIFPINSNYQFTLDHSFEQHTTSNLFWSSEKTGTGNLCLLKLSREKDQDAAVCLNRVKPTYQIGFLVCYLRLYTKETAQAHAPTFVILKLRRQLCQLVQIMFQLLYS